MAKAAAANSTRKRGAAKTRSVEAPAPPANVSSELAKRFRLNGYVRRPNAELRAEAPDSYKKGYEIRLVADSQVELREVRRLLRAAGFEPGRPFAKSNQWRQPVYGRLAVNRFLQLVGQKPPVKREGMKPKARRGLAR